jgi:hypothetical protein
VLRERGITLRLRGKRFREHASHCPLCAGGMVSRIFFIITFQASKSSELGSGALELPPNRRAPMRSMAFFEGFFFFVRVLLPVRDAPASASANPAAEV